MFAVVRDFLSSRSLALESASPKRVKQYYARSDVAHDVYCDNPECNLNVPVAQVVPGPSVQRMEWKAKNGSVKHFCETCTKAILTWQAETA